jgi:8-oxo-dGTP pyrophosphatase MutT (NUDIX family)
LSVDADAGADAADEAGPPMSRVPRVGGRLLLVDPDDRVLLIHERLEFGGTHWLTPGGGVEAGEGPADAAAREAVEEVGIAVSLPAGAEPVLTTRRDWSWDGVDYDQVDHFFLVRVPDGTVAQPQELTGPEQQTRIGERWWSVAELRATEDVLVPPDLADVLSRLLPRG